MAELVQLPLDGAATRLTVLMLAGSNFHFICGGY